MSYGGVENMPEDLDFLVGGEIASLEIVQPKDLPEVKENPELLDYSFEVIVMQVRLRKPIIDGETKEIATKATIQVWQDVEGNGPGYLSLVGLDK